MEDINIFPLSFNKERAVLISTQIPVNMGNCLSERDTESVHYEPSGIAFRVDHVFRKYTGDNMLHEKPHISPDYLHVSRVHPAQRSRFRENLGI